MKRVFGWVELIFDTLYMLTALVLGAVLLWTGTPSAARILAGAMAFVLVGGDAFHLVPRMCVIATQQEERYSAALGRGKQITSITMTVFYLLLWHVGLLLFAPALPVGYTIAVYALALVRIVLCLLPQNKWCDRYPPVDWGIWRNAPFFVQGAAVAALFFVGAQAGTALWLMWIGIVVSFACYLPVVFWSNKNAKIGMLMLPKTCAYIFMMVLLLWA